MSRLKNLAGFAIIEDDIWWDNGQNISPKYIDGDMVLLLGLTEEKVEGTLNEEDEGWADLFYSIEKWNPKLRPGFRLAWLQCWGIPLVAWDTLHIKHIVSGIGEVVDVDDKVEERRRLDVARILIKTSWKPWIQHTVHVRIKGEMFLVHVAEESGRPGDTWHLKRQYDFSSSEEINSEEGDDEGEVNMWRYNLKVLDMMEDNVEDRRATGGGMGEETRGLDVELSEGAKVNDDSVRGGRSERGLAQFHSGARTTIDNDEGADDVEGGGDDDRLKRGGDYGRHLSTDRAQEPMVVAKQAAQSGGAFGQSSRIDSTNKAIVQRSATHLKFAQTDAQCMQSCSVLGTEA